MSTFSQINMASETSEHVIVDIANSNTSNNNTVTASTKFRWDKEQKVEILEFSNKDFNGDNIQQMARIYEHQPSYFESLNSYVFSDKLKIQKNLKDTKECTKKSNN